MATLIDIGSLIVQVPEVRGGRPCIAGTGVSVQRVVGWYKLGLMPEEIADRIGHITLAQVHAALAYYHANQEIIERSMQMEETEADQLEAEYLASERKM